MPSKTVTKKSTKSKVVAKKVEATETAKKVAPVKKVAPAKKATPTKKATPAVKATPAKKTTPVKKVAQKGGEDKQLTKSGKVVRSFKVQLPGDEEFTGRFTGSMPYQAASKALSKYYRTVENPKSTITFTIKESTRGSNRSSYTYEGHRVKLDTPVEYSIAGGNTITKAYKNHLKKVKKADLPKEENL